MSKILPLFILIIALVTMIGIFFQGVSPKANASKQTSHTQNSPKTEDQKSITTENSGEMQNSQEMDNENDKIISLIEKQETPKESRMHFNNAKKQNPIKQEVLRKNQKPQEKSQSTTIRKEIKEVGTLSYLKIIPEKAVLQQGEKMIFTIHAYNAAHQEINIEVNWDSNAGEIQKKDQNSVILTLDTSLPVSWIRCSDAKGHVETTAYIHTTPSSQLSSISVLGNRKIEISPGDKHQFQVKCFDQFNHPYPSKLQWRAEGGEIDENGLFLAGNQPGEYKVTVGNSQIHEEFTVVVLAKSQLQRIAIISPEGPISPGETYRFQAVGYDQNDNKVPFYGYWKASGGFCRNNGVFVAGKHLGTYTVVVRDSQTGLIAEQQFEIAYPINKKSFKFSKKLVFYGKLKNQTERIKLCQIEPDIQLNIYQNQSGYNYEIQYSYEIYKKIDTYDYDPLKWDLEFTFYGKTKYFEKSKRLLVLRSAIADKNSGKHKVFDRGYFERIDQIFSELLDVKLQDND